MKDRFLKGYKLVHKPEHFSTMTAKNWRGYIYEHRYVMEAHINRPLYSYEIVHHKDHNKLNNGIENLEILTRSEHNALHSQTPIIHECEGCEALLNIRNNRCKKCTEFNKRKVKDRPSKEELAELIRQFPWVRVGKLYGVSDNAVRKWARAYSLI